MTMSLISHYVLHAVTFSVFKICFTILMTGACTQVVEKLILQIRTQVSPTLTHNQLELRRNEVRRILGNILVSKASTDIR